MSIDIEKLSARELVELAESRGLTKEIRGMTIEWVRDFLKKNKGLEEPIEEPIGESKEEVQTNGVKDESLSWPGLKRLAKSKGINTYKKKRDEIESLLKTENVIV